MLVNLAYGHTLAQNAVEVSRDVEESILLVLRDLEVIEAELSFQLASDIQLRFLEVDWTDSIFIIQMCSTHMECFWWNRLPERSKTFSTFFFFFALSESTSVCSFMIFISNTTQKLLLTFVTTDWPQPQALLLDLYHLAWPLGVLSLWPLTLSVSSLIGG